MTPHPLSAVDAGPKSAGGKRPSWLRLPRRIDTKLRNIARSVEHGRVRQQIAEDGVFSYHYAFMTAMAAGIAIIGLLLNSPAVIIGAMLISPLMGPIMATGFSLAMLDADLGRRSFGALMAGALMAVAMTAAIVLASPVQDATPEILARTRPNLFDLVVAVLSGAAGGYAMVRGRGGTVVGVAIATALMPPLAVAGYGLATFQWSISRGAALLFLTNMVAISAAAALVAEWYGFGRGGIRKAFARQALVSLVLLAPLSIPLFLSLRDIAQESYAQAVIRRAIGAEVAKLEDGQLARLQVRFAEGRAIHADAIVMTEAPRPGLREEVLAKLEKELGRPLVLRLSQVRSEEQPAGAGVGAFGRLLDPPAQPAQPPPTLAETIRAAAPIPLRSVESDEAARTVTILAGAHPDLDLKAFRAIEAELAQRYGGWRVQLVPPMLPLPELRFESGSYALPDAALDRLETAAWALERWNVKNVAVTGYASSDGAGTRTVAARRAQEVARWLEARGFDTRSEARFPAENQRARERMLGLSAFRKVEISPLLAPRAEL